MQRGTSPYQKSSPEYKITHVLLTYLLSLLQKLISVLPCCLLLLQPQLQLPAWAGNKSHTCSPCIYALFYINSSLYKSSNDTINGNLCLCKNSPRFHQIVSKKRSKIKIFLGEHATCLHTNMSLAPHKSMQWHFAPPLGKKLKETLVRYCYNSMFVGHASATKIMAHLSHPCSLPNGWALGQLRAFIVTQQCTNIPANSNQIRNSRQVTKLIWKSSENKIPFSFHFQFKDKAEYWKSSLYKLCKRRLTKK